MNAESSVSEGRSKFVDFVLERTLDRTILAMMMQVVATDGTSFATADIIERIMDEKIVEALVGELSINAIFD